MTQFIWTQSFGCGSAALFKGNHLDASAVSCSQHWSGTVPRRAEL